MTNPSRLLARGLAVEEKQLFAQLKKIPLLMDLSASALARLAQQAEVKALRRRQVVYLPGDPGTAVFLLVSGRVKISKVTRDGKELTLAYRTAGELFGEFCILDGGPREEMAESMEISNVLELARQDFEKMVQNHGMLGYRLAKMMLVRRRELENKVEQLLFKDVSAKLAELLLRLGNDYGVASGKGTLVGLKITHQEMANLIGSTRETVSLTLSQFKRKGFIQTDGRKVIIADREGLRALA